MIRTLLRLLLLWTLLAAGAGTVALSQDTTDEPIAATGATSDLPRVIDARVSTTPERARLVLDLTAPTAFAIVSLDEPNRIAVDVQAAGLDFSQLQAIAGEGLVATFAVEQAEPERVRATLTLGPFAQVQQAYLLEPFQDQPARLVVDLIPATEEEFTAKVAADLAAATLSTNVQVAGSTTQPTEPGGSNLPTQTRPLVVIDPGHGGVDTGATAPSGVHEKDIVLAFALKLQELLVASGRFDVALTREADGFLQLADRVELARANKADLFVSIHADSFQQPEVRGASVYILDENATDALDKVLADQENKADIVAGLTPPQTPAKAVDILIDLMQREMRRQSYLAAQAVVHQLEPSVELRKFPVRQANFFVLQAPDVPSILVELGFLSNADDIANLERGEWQRRTAEALARGIATYFDTLRQEQAEP